MISPMVNGCGFNPRAHAGRDARFSVSSTMNALFQSTRPRGARPSARRSISRHGVCFNPRAHAGRDAYKSATVHTHKRFQSTRPRGARQSCHRPNMAEASVSIHAPTRGATDMTASTAGANSRFNPRAHAGRDRFPLESLTLQSSFNPRAHAGRDAPRRYVRPFPEQVSIHAPTRGATRPVDSSNPISTVSIHAPTRGATLRALLREGRSMVSIHAPTRGATVAFALTLRGGDGFNPRAHAGRDMIAPTMIGDASKFQSTRPRGARLGPNGAPLRPSNRFNPRAHAGRDPDNPDIRKHMHDVSIHAPTRGATFGGDSHK